MSSITKKSLAYCILYTSSPHLVYFGQRRPPAAAECLLGIEGPAMRDRYRTSLSAAELIEASVSRTPSSVYRIEYEAAENATPFTELTHLN